MSIPSSLPRGDECVSLYQQIYAGFSDDWFTLEELQLLLAQGRNGDRSRNKEDLGYILALLVASGLLDRDERKGHQIRCKPGESSAQWHAKIEQHVEAIHRYVHASDGPARPSTPQRREDKWLRREGERYHAIAVGAQTGFRELVLELTEVFERNPDQDNVVLKAPATEMGSVQRIADKLYDAEEMAETKCPYRFEKDDSEVVGEHKDALEYRLFLTVKSI